MSETSRHDAWQGGSNYDTYMGRWSRQIAARFVGWLEVPPGKDWLEVGCGTGALTRAVLEGAGPRTILSVDTSEDFVRHAARECPDPRATFQTGDGQRLDLPDRSRDAVVSGLVLNFVPDKGAMLAEMVRIARPGGRLGFYVWDYPAGGVGFIHAFWRAAAALDPAAETLSEDRRFPDCTREALAGLASGAWGPEAEVVAVEVPTPFASFEDFWHPFTLGAGPAPGYCAGLSPDAREKLRRKLDADLPRAPDGSIPLSARAWAVRASAPV
ncbi:class I SAM-dependent methyltransferase [Defluviimonas sp. SAOS-178_SWC]|uniref:class I SAM-dependent methyltransferase n=1 Tax=Defluviimonas sp. SAOS-178_SWC TaxID=3121287 RepID=UPI003221C604